MCGEERTHGMVIELLAVVSLNAADRSAELCLDKGMKAQKRRQRIRLMAKGECPCLMRMIIQYHKIKTITRVANYWGCPYIKMK